MSANSSMSKNLLLAALPEEEYQRLAPHLELVSLQVRQVIHESLGPIAHVYFPHEAMISIVNIMEDGSTVEVGLVGREGMAGIPTILGGNISLNQTFVQIADGATRLRADILKTELDRGGELQKLLLRYCQALLCQASQSAACNRFHTIEERLARWMLSVSDCINSDEFLLTQEFIAQMLGVRRSGVTVAANILSQAGMLHYSRGRVTIVNREVLEATTCECYKTIKGEFKRLLIDWPTSDG